ncbi:MAG: type II toxin-antitoxin system Phd/YefM family antitoxin [Rhodanobacteraceae bacterium]|jgi:prevent-host-death family protein|nr:type II toxin-antitoxin system Phd/YefM family antitoxin [Rhodanobacteraceae bacterium]MBL0040382.1 type II toxin-antitoxin system Phd/YefM family antitoxin [Xanthomonadales bacterium]MBP6079366.1 type II toxin-antitoxin system Phd/YefM family antitoxin [Xanthomonadales bacterium]MBP7622777.1 type II toxin-antitoxin system Phd/YefM family antitoxin [Xanthomonadales bacterium]HWT16479.1 type II toxin-antitoxin system Phd/YefM family antitoxin [Patescibacteria group bacterium]
MTTASIHEAKTHLSKLIQKALAGEEVIIANAGKPVVKLVPVEQPEKKIRQFGGWEGQVWMADDFDAPLDDFKDYM